MKFAAIKHARANVALSNMGEQWRVDTYDARARAFLDRDLIQYEGGPWTSYL
jgi:hypothetical protein